MSTMDLGKSIKELLREGKTVVVYTPDDVVEEEQAVPIEEVPPYPLQPWAMKKIIAAIMQPLQERPDIDVPLVWIPERFQVQPGQEPRSPLGRKVRTGWWIRFTWGVSSWSIFAGERLMRAIRENFPEYIDWENRIG